MTNEIYDAEDTVQETASLPSTEPTPTSQFKLDVPTIEVDIDVSSDPHKLKVVSARMRRATKDELVKREAMSLTEFVEASATEDDIVVEEERGNSWLFDEVVTEVKGFRLPGESPEVVKEFRPATSDLLNAIYPSYKAAFVKGAYNVTAKFFEDDFEGVTLGGTETLPVDLIFGDEENALATIRFELPEPTDSERRTYGNEAVKLRQPKGSRKSRNRIISNLSASVRLFDVLMIREGASISMLDSATRVTVQGRTFAESTTPMAKQVFIDAIDPLYKKAVLTAAMSKYNAKVQD